MSFGLSLQRRRPVRIERHQTREWGWRWSCAKCGKADMRVPAWRTAIDAALGHECVFAATSDQPLITTHERSAAAWDSWYPDIRTKVYL